MTNAKRKISQQQWFFILVFSNICVTPFTFTPVLYQIVGVSAWIAIVLSFLLSLWNIYITIYICHTFRYENVAEWSGRVLGKVFGKIYTLLAVLIIYIWSVLMLEVFLELIIDSQLPYTPRLLILLFLIGSVVYLLVLGLETWARWAEFFALILIVMLIVMNVGQMKNVTLGHLLPIEAHFQFFTSGDGLKREVIASLFIFRGIFALYFMYPYIRVKKRFTALTIAGTAFSFIEILLAVMLPILIFGSTFIQKIAFPYQASLETVRLGFLPIDRISILASIVWQLIIVYVLSVSFFSTAEGLRTMFKMKKNNVLVIVLGVLTLFITLFPIEKQISAHIMIYWSFAGIVIFTIVPTFIWIILKWMELE